MQFKRESAAAITSNDWTCGRVGGRENDSKEMGRGDDSCQLPPFHSPDIPHKSATLHMPTIPMCACALAHAACSSVTSCVLYSHSPFFFYQMPLFFLATQQQN